MAVCKFCQSTAVFKHGLKNGLQRYLCRECGHHFFIDNGVDFPRMRNKADVIAAAMNLYFEGLSARKVQKQMKSIFDQEISQGTIWNWASKYSTLVAKYTRNLAPQLSGKIHHDETAIKVDGSYRWFWEAIDEETRMIVASHLSGERTTEETIKQFNLILEKGKPNVLLLDGSQNYERAFNKVFYSRYKSDRVEMVRKVGIKSRETNNMVERLHGTLKDRIKPMRGLKNMKTAQILLNGWVTHYNYCREHQSIKMTPAQAAGIEIKGWKSLIKMATTDKIKKEVNMEQPIEVRMKI